MKAIQLTQGKIAWVDDDDFERINAHKWFASRCRRNIYAARMSPTFNGKRRHIWMHHDVLNIKPGVKIDHADHNGLINTKSNLRICTGLKNSHNRRKNLNGSSRFKGVSWDHEQRKWRALIRVRRRLSHIGRFSSEETAALAYDKAARRIFGGFAAVNFAKPGEISAFTNMVYG